MKKILLLFFALWSAVVSIAQTSDAEKNVALQFVSANRAAIGLTAEDLNNLKVTFTAIDKVTGLRIINMQQTFKGIPVYNQYLVLSFKNNKLVSTSGTLLPMYKYAYGKPTVPSVPAESAVQSALTDRGLVAAEPASVVSKGKTNDGNEKLIFGKLGVARDPITAELLWVPATDGKSVNLGWQVYIDPVTSSDMWLVRVDGSNSRVLDVTNLTVYCNWDDPNHINMPNHTHATAGTENTTPVLFDFNKVNGAPSIVNGASYRVVKIPAESPQHPNGAPQLVTDPWTSAPGNATSLKWHSDGTTDYNYTRGNNVWAYEDRTAPQNTGSPAKSATSTTPDPLTFNFIPDFTVNPTQSTPVQNQQFNITNLFYWNNVIHDVMYQYGFDEVWRNFQDNNQGRGGNGNDHINAEAQDPSNTNNANFSTPSDGGSGRMQMFLWTSATPNKDGDVDNGIIIHEASHGTSNRLHPTASCLGNAEQMGEGWSDYYGIMMTQDWANSNLNSGATPRGVGTYALNQPVTGVGIRPAPYCTDMAINNFTYANLPTMAIPHGVGFVWCTILWDMTWNIIQQNGTITPNIYDASGTGGNIIAMKLVTAGMKLEPCNPGFIDGRNAILAADQALYGGLHACSIKEAFRRRGLGDGASQGSSGSTTDGTSDFSGGTTLKLTQVVNHVPEGANIQYINTITTAACGGITNYVLTDTLPSNVTFFSATAGGTWDPVNRVVKWNVTQAASTTATYNFQARIYGGAYYAPNTIINDAVTTAPPTIPAAWTATSTTGGTNVWSVVNTQSHSAPNSFFTNDPGVVSDQILARTNSFALGANPVTLSFWHWYNLENTFDGGVVEISTNGGGSWGDVGITNYTLNPYNGTIDAGFSNPIAGRRAFTGNSLGFIQSKVNLAPYVNQANVKLRWRMGSDNLFAATGWWLDDILLQDIAHVDMRSNLFNALGVRTLISDTTTLIDPPVGGCVAPEFLVQPRDTVACAGGLITFTASAVATPPLTYVWQENGVDLANGGSYSGVTTTTLTINPVTAGMIGHTFRLRAIGCPTNVSVNSNNATLNTAPAAVGGTTAPAVTNICSVVNSGTITLTGHTGNVVRWEQSTVSATGPWTNIANTTTSFSYSTLASGTYYYRAVLAFPGCTEAFSTVAQVNVQALGTLVIAADPGTTLCAGDPTRLTAVETTGLTSVTITQSSSTTVTAANTAICASPFPIHADNSLWRAFTLPQTTPVTINSATFGVQSAVAASGSQPVTVRLYTNTGGTFPAGTRTLVGTQNFTVPNMSLALFTGNFTTPVTVPGNSVLVMELFTPASGPGNSFITGSNAAAQTGTSYISAASCGITTPTDVAAIGFPNMHLVMSLAGTTPTLGGPVTGGTFLWSPAAGLSSTTSNPVAASPATTTTYTVTHNNGLGCTRTANITITVNQRPAVTTPPSSVVVCEGAPASFTAATSGTGTSVQWQVSTTGAAGPYTNIPVGAPYTGTTTNTLGITAVTNAMNGNYYRIAVSGICPPVANSAGALLTVNPLPVVTITPASPICGGVPGVNGILLTASSPTGGNFIWTPAAGLFTNAQATTAYVAGTPTATVYAAPTANTVYTVSATNGTTGCVGSNTITVNYTPAVPTITPAAVAICLTTPKSVAPLQITSSLSGFTTTTYASGPISVPVNDNTANGTSSSITPTLPAGSIITGLSVTINMVHTYPGDMIFNLRAPNGKILNLYKYNGGTFTGASGNLVGAGWFNGKVNSTSTVAFNSVGAPYAYGTPPTGTPTGPFKPDAINAALGQVVENPNGFVSNALNFGELYLGSTTGAWTLAMADGGPGDLGTLTSWALDITYSAPTTGIWSVAGSNPPTYTGLYTDAAGTVAYTGTPLNIVYASPAATTTYQVTVANGTCVSQPKTVVVTVNNPVAITTQPALVVKVCTNNVATFSVTASGTTPTYQWQVSTDNNTWTNIANGGVYSGATTRTLTITAPPLSMNGYQYRVIVSGTAPCGSVTSQQTLLTVNPLPTVNLSANPYMNLVPGLTTTLTASVTPNPAAPNGFAWFRDGVAVPNASSNTLPVTIDGLGNYTVTVTDVNGCVNTSDPLLIGDSASGKVFIYPNPNSGSFQVRYYSGLNNTNLPRGLNIFDDKGARISMQKYSINAPYARMDVDMRKFGSGTYWVEVVDNKGDRLAIGRVVILR